MLNCVWKETDGSCPSMYLVLCNNNHVSYYLVLDKSKEGAKLLENPAGKKTIRFKGELRALPGRHVPVVKLEFD
jgi:hypothetical protein